MSITQERQNHADTVLAETLGRLDGQGDDYASLVVAMIRTTLKQPPMGTLRKWMVAHNGEVVTTVQIHNGNGTAWTPTGRTIDASKSTYVELSGSARYYAEMHVVATAPNVIIVADDEHTIAYVIEPTV